MKNTFIKELQWRGLLQDIMPGTEKLFENEIVTAYIGFDPTANSLHIGHLMQIITLIRLQNFGHIPIALIGGATGMIGDPSGKSSERNLLPEQTLRDNIEGIKKQLTFFLNDKESGRSAELVNNFDWMNEFSFINFIRDIGKHLSVNYMLAKDSVKNRLESGMSFTEFSYQLIQGYDFYYLFKNKNCKVQIGGSDQWGNITSGTELIRKKDNLAAFGLTTQLIKKSDGSKFGKTESGTIWLDKLKTSPYKFYQFWINSSDIDAKNFIKAFTFLTNDKIDELILAHDQDAGLRILQKELAKQLTILVHGNIGFMGAIETSSLLFNGSFSDLSKLEEAVFLDVFEGVPQFIITKNELADSISVIDFLAEKTSVMSSKSEAKKIIQGGGISINKKKVESIDLKIQLSDLVNNKYIIIQKGKKNYYLCIVN